MQAIGVGDDDVVVGAGGITTEIETGRVADVERQLRLKADPELVLGDVAELGTI